MSEARLSVVIPTSMRRSNPSTFHIEKCLDSLEQFGLRSCEKIVVCDGFHPHVNIGDTKYRTSVYGEARSEDYDSYKDRLKSLARERYHNCRVVELSAHKHLAGVEVVGFQEASGPVVLSFQHDFYLLRDLPWTSIVEELTRPGTPIKHLRLNKRANRVARQDSVLIPEPGVSFPVLKTDNWSNNPYFMLCSTFEREIKPLYDDKQKTTFERLLWGKRKQVGLARELYRQHPFEEIHPRFGTYVFGELGDPAVVDHIPFLEGVRPLNLAQWAKRIVKTMLKKMGAYP